MKMIIIAFALVAVAVAAPVVPDDKSEVLKNIYNLEPEGGYVSGYETENGIKSEAVGVLKEVRDEENKPQLVLEIRGSYSYIKEDGTVETITYVADENGYNAKGPSIPVAPVARR